MAQRFLHHDRMMVLFAHALSMGAVRTGAASARWDISGDCRNGYLTVVRGRPGHKQRMIDPYVDILPKAGRIPYWLDLITRCRRCDRCLRYRAWKWRTRALEEVRLGSRTWFGTLTVDPDHHFLALSRVRAACHEQGYSFDDLDEVKRFALLVKEHGRELTLYVKRLRKYSQVRIRYLIVAEKHKSGLPHFHMLIHERGGEIKHKLLSAEWHLGFEKWRLTSTLEPQKALYLCKYLSKDLTARVRASQSYGIGLRSWIVTQLEKLSVKD